MAQTPAAELLFCPNAAFGEKPNFTAVGVLELHRPIFHVVDTDRKLN